jgi:hypothetical protein
MNGYVILGKYIVNLAQVCFIQVLEKANFNKPDEKYPVEECIRLTFAMGESWNTLEFFNQEKDKLINLLHAPVLQTGSEDYIYSTNPVNR